MGIYKRLPGLRVIRVIGVPGPVNPQFLDGRLRRLSGECG
jgi:hypothetical protein